MNPRIPKSGNSPKINKIVLLIVAISSFLLGFAAHKAQQSVRGNIFFSAERHLDYAGRLTNPLLECENFEGGDISLESTEIKIRKYINKQINENAAKEVSAYVRDLNNGPWIGINENNNFAPASLLKVPIMIAYLKLAESDPEILGNKIKFENVSYEIPQEIPPLKSVRQGNSYTVDELLRYMIVYSDNAAKDLLLVNLDEDSMNKVYRDLQLDIPNERTPQDFISVRQYASFFRILYNCSYLSRAMSEKALELLSGTDFADGIKAGIPAGIKFASKFGEREDDTAIKQLHDCGIVYYHRAPYLICVMTKGQDINKLKNIIKDISGIVYNDIRNKNS